jgi:superfamily II DNA or RNA helicase
MTWPRKIATTAASFSSSLVGIFDFSCALYLASNNYSPIPDEAHRGSGDYAYAQIVRFLMAKNPHFRVLALTATPGSTPDAVQAIVDALHISHIELRDENSLDLKEYVFKKVGLTNHRSHARRLSY